MIKIIGNNTSDCAPVSSSCVIWQGPNIPCLEIETGDEINGVVEIIAKKVCELAEPLDLDQLSLAAFLQICNQTEPVDRTLINVLQLMIDNNVCLKDLIDQILIRLGILEGEDTFTILLECLGESDGFGNPTEVTERGLLQILVHNICTLRGNIADINTTLVSLQDQINILAEDDGIIEEYIVTIPCIDNIPRPTHLELVKVGETFCDYRDNVVGTAAEWATAFAQFCEELDAKYSTIDPNWILPQNRVTAADYFNNLMIAVCSHEDRITTIEDTCCALTCDDVKIGFSVIVGEAANNIVLRFRGIDGTSIPAGFADCGSTVLITDVHGTQEQYPIVIEQEGQTDDLDVSGLDLTQPLDINLTSKMCNSSYNCSQCSSRKFNFNAAGCPVCLITTSFIKDGGTVTVIYETP